MTESPSHVLFLFFDGVGLGPYGIHNPLSVQHWYALEALAGGQPWCIPFQSILGERHLFHGIDASLGIPGLPQSGTGQASLFTGVNAARLAGRHFGPYPHSRTREAIATRNVFRRVAQLFPEHEEPSVFANAFPPRFFSYCEERDRWTVTTRCCLDAGLRIRTMEDLKARGALAADLTSAGLQRFGIDVDVRTPREAGRILVDLAHRHVFTLFEYYLTDKAGHSRDPDRARAVLADVDAFIGSVMEHLDRDRDLLIVTSDHGNIEDMSIKTHTGYPVPLVVLGPGAPAFRDVTDLTGVVPALEDLLRGK